MQVEDSVSIKNAKVYPRGISFTANNMALVYLLDEAGARTTTDMFHDLYSGQLEDTMFHESLRRAGPPAEMVSASVEMLEQMQFWQNMFGVNCWDVAGVQQTPDGLVSVERFVDSDCFLLKASPANGKVRVNSTFLQTTDSLGEESHVFLRSGDRRLHYSGRSTVFTVRQSGHSAGFDETGSLRIF